MSFTLKKTTFLAFSSMLVFAFSSSSFADSCDSLLKAGIYNVTQSSSAEDSQSLAKSTFCSADYSNTSNSRSTQAAIEASYAGFGGGASGSVSTSEIVTKQSQVCTSGFNSSAYSNQASAYAKTVYQGSLDAWNQCQALANKGVIFESQTDSGLQGVTVTLSAPAGASSKFLGMSQMGTGRFLCRTTLPARGTSLTGKLIVIDASTAFTFDSASKLIINCQRQMRLSPAGDLNADAQTLVFNTSAGAYQVPMAAIGAYSRMSFDKAQAQIEENTRNLIIANLNNTLVISCDSPQWMYTINSQFNSYSPDIYSCNITVPKKGILSLHLNGYIMGASCRYSIFLDNSIVSDKDSTYTNANVRESAHISSTVLTTPGIHTISVRSSTGDGNPHSCDLSGSKITGIFIPTSL